MLRSVFGAIGLGLVLGLSACAQPEKGASDQESAVHTEELTIDTAAGPVRFNVEIADTEEERARGLMFRPSLADDHGMLFDFNPPEAVSFWMHNTMISLDIIFIGTDGRILNIADHATPYSDASIPSAGVARGVLEIGGGRAEALGIHPGDRVHHRIFPEG